MEQKNNVINICFSSDNNYAQHMSVAITSILKNTKEENQYNFFVLDGGISDKNKKNIEKLKKIKNFSIKYIKVNKDDFKTCPMTGYVNYITLPTYYRFKIPSLIEEDKVLYIDCDIIVKKDIAELFNTDIENYYLAAVPEVSQHTHKPRVNIEGDNWYCNAGVLLINNKKWREDNIEKKLFDYSINPDMEIIYQDQDIINQVLKYHIKYLPLNWNVQHGTICWDQSYLYHQKERLKAIEDPYIIHYTHKYKPWNIKCTNKFRNEYFKYLKLTPYKNQFYIIKIKKLIRSFIKGLFSINKKEFEFIIRILGIKFSFKRKHNILLSQLYNLSNQNQEIKKQNYELLQKIHNDLNWMKHPLYCIDGGVNTIFRYMTGIQLTKDYQTERVVVFDPDEAPIDHYERYKFVKEFINENDEVLDIACGVGYGSADIAKKAKRVLGVDINNPSVNFANKIFACDNLSYKCANALELDLEEKFDKIVSFETIEHIIEDEKFLLKLNSFLKDDGILICSVPNQTIFPYDPKKVPFHIKHYTVNDILDLLNKTGFCIEDIYFQYENENHKVLKKEGEEGYTIVCVARKK